MVRASNLGGGHMVEMTPPPEPERVANCWRPRVTHHFGGGYSDAVGDPDHQGLVGEIIHES